MLIVFSLLDFNYRDHIAEFDSVDSHCTAGKPAHTHSRLAPSLIILHPVIKCLFWRLVVDRLCVWDSVQDHELGVSVTQYLTTFEAEAEISNSFPE